MTFIHYPFKVLDNVNASDMNIIKVTSYNTCSLIFNRCTSDKLYLEVNTHNSNCIIKSRLYYALINIHKKPRSKNMSQSAKS